MNSQSLQQIFEGWDGYQKSLVSAVSDLTEEQLAFRAAPEVRTAAEIVRHLSSGRLTWLLRIEAPGSVELANKVSEWHTDADGARHVKEESISLDKAILLEWLKESGAMVEAMLHQWTTEELAQSYRHKFRGTTYQISFQWTIFRILLHDIHHGGQLSLVLEMQGIVPLELGWLGGHLTEPHRVEQ